MGDVRSRTRWSAVAAAVLLGWLSVVCPAVALAELVLQASVNGNEFAPGDTMRLTIGLINPGADESVDFYLGILRPDLTIQFVTAGGLVTGSLLDLSSFVAAASGVSLATPFALVADDFFSRAVTAEDPTGLHVFFFLALTAGSLQSATDGPAAGPAVGSPAEPLVSIRGIAADTFRIVDPAAADAAAR